ncbi:aldose 1-epimerase family protein [Sphingomonas sp.]|uniref:aldose 1-epimerase family protein n=1 Tax=Sphingomonas sp. TaxID=28214 RepID=UPI001D4F2E90|nr:aldose 1-epimerase family protein [Sphingomonas sp.]MBX9797513.1 aldose 1-epimerase family protein [Sphingomonas sp.]
MIRISSGTLSAAINPLGAELSSLTDGEGRELMTDADPAFWTGRAPILFPVVGRVRDDRIVVDGVPHPMPKHGFARAMPFALVEAGAAAARFRLTDSEATRVHYPFAFALDLDFALAGATLTMTATVTNPAGTPLPMSLGWHPAFAWPLPYGAARAAHRLAFAMAEDGPMKRITPAGYSTPRPAPNPVDGAVLPLADALFTDDALVWDPVASRALRYGPAEGPWLDIGWDGPRLGVWTKPGARYVCVEPWHGIADPEDFAGDFAVKPGIVTLAPGARWASVMTITLTR